MHRQLFSLLTCLVVSTHLQADALDDYQWEQRIILYQTEEDEVLEALERSLRQYGDGIEDRDLVFLRLGSKPDLPFHESLTPEVIRKLRERYETHTEPTVFILIGKDGGEKDRQESALDLPAWFDRIDAMPMRRREMRE